MVGWCSAQGLIGAQHNVYSLHGIELHDFTCGGANEHGEGFVSHGFQADLVHGQRAGVYSQRARLPHDALGHILGVARLGAIQHKHTGLRAQTHA